MPSNKKEKTMIPNSTIDLLLTRRSVVAAKITTPGPTPEELDTILRCATRVPDHGKLTPWRIRVAQGEAQRELGQILSDIYTQKNPMPHPSKSTLNINAPAEHLSYW